jgi:hypothetical protein
MRVIGGDSGGGLVKRSEAIRVPGHERDDSPGSFCIKVRSYVYEDYSFE